MARVKKSGLGKGLDSLIPAGLEVERTEPIKKEAEKQPDAYVRLSLIEPNRNQPRKQFEEDSLQELADSLKIYGVIQPLIVRKKNDHYEIVAGERRWRAAKLAGLKEVPVLIREYDDAQISEIALIENLQRKDLNPMEEAMAYRTLMEEYGLKQADVAEKVSKSRTVITNALRLLKLNPQVQELVANGQISTGHAKVLLGLENMDLQLSAAEQIIKEELSVRETENLVKKWNAPQKPPKEKVVLSNHAVYQDLETRMKERVGTKVQIKRKNEKAGKIEIEYYSTEDLERISELLGI